MGTTRYDGGSYVYECTDDDDNVVDDAYYLYYSCYKFDNEYCYDH